jgi:ABC-type transport system involved in cytochrome c biogenesis permease subunit
MVSIKAKAAKRLSRQPLGGFIGSIFLYIMKILAIIKTVVYMIGIVVAIITIVLITAVMFTGEVSGYYIQQISNETGETMLNSALLGSIIVSIIFSTVILIIGGIVSATFIISGKIIQRNLINTKQK